MSAIIFFSLGVIGIVLFAFGIYFPLSISVLLLIWISAFFVKSFLRGRIGLLVLQLFIVYALPFIHIPTYIWFDFNSNPSYLWGLVTNPYMLEKNIVTLTAMIGAMGALGMGFGATINRSNLQGLNLIVYDTNRVNKTLSIVIWQFWVAVGFVLSLLVAPSETIFVSAYSQSDSALTGAGFGSAWMISYIILTYTFCDAIIEPNKSIRIVKKGITITVVGIIVVYLQILRGDRESIPWVYSLALIYFYWAAGFNNLKTTVIPWKKIIYWIIVLLVISNIIGGIRSNLAGQDLRSSLELFTNLIDLESFSISNILHGTWSAALLTPLSVAGDQINGLLDLKLGQDYLNFLLSLPPGFIADLIGYTRPISDSIGPAWEMRYGLGGTHATVVPFMNFRMVGVFFIPALWTWFFFRYERKAIKRLSVLNLVFFGGIVTAAPHWLWYGEKAIINTLIILFVLNFFYRVSLALSHGEHSITVRDIK